MNKQKLKEKLKEIPKELLNYLSDLNEDKKPLGQKNQEKIRQFMHTMYGKYVNWVAEKIIDWQESKEDTNVMMEELKSSVERFGKQTQKVIVEKVSKTKRHLIEEGKFDMADRVAKTYYNCAETVLEKDMQAPLKLVEINQEEKKEAIFSSK